jgi:FkbH-like protein
LKFEDFSSFKANWNEKYKNIIEIVREVNIGLDSLVFIDDNPFERELACSQLPILSVPDVGNNITEFISYIDRNGYFEPISLSIDDKNRGKYYKDNKKRVDVLAEFTSYDDFLNSLEMVAEIKSFSQIYLNRITQLINKTNQFNLTTKRFTFSEVESIWGNNKFIKIYGKLSDKYGSNGLVSVVIGEIEGNVCYINLWVMSCRVIKRDLEFAMFDKLVKLCSNNKISMIVGKYYKSTKNNLVSDLYEKLGFTLRSRNNNDSIWEIDISSYKNKNNIIRINI